MPLGAHEHPPGLLLIVQEQQRSGQQQEYAKNESAIAAVCARLRCPHPYVALESLASPETVWWLNAFQAETERERVELAYAQNEALMAELRPLGAQKTELTFAPVTILTQYRPDLSVGTAWRMAGTRFFVVELLAQGSSPEGSVFEASDGVRYMFVSASTRDVAEGIVARRGGSASVFAIRPEWSFGASAWVDADREFWHPGGGTAPDSVRP